MHECKEIAQYCAENIEDWNLKVNLALRHIAGNLPIDAGFASEVEDRAYEWCDANDVSVDFFEPIDPKEIILSVIDDEN